MQVTLNDGTALACDDQPFASGKDGAAHWSSDGRLLVKLYHDPEPWREPTLQDVLTRYNAVIGEPYWESLLCWPVNLVRSPRLGIVVPRAPSGLKKVACFLLPRWLAHHPEDYGHWHGRVGLAIRLSRAVRRLHVKGLCHSDLSDNNILGDAHNGRLYIIDIDGLVVPGRARPVVLGSPGIMAPELESGETDAPSVATDLHSLAVLIYQVLLLQHPLVGGKVHDPSDPARDESLRFGKGALFIEHPTDRSNRPTYLDRPSTLLSANVARLVQRAFVQGLHAPSKRPQASDWERALVSLADALVVCQNPACVFKSFPLPEVLGVPPVLQCPWCGTRVRGFSLPVLHWHSPSPGQTGLYRSDSTRLVALPDVTLHQWHIQPNTLPGPQVQSTVLAQVAQHGGRSYLVNRQLPYCEYADRGQAWKRVRPNEGSELRHERTLRFGPPGQSRVATVELLQL